MSEAHKLDATVNVDVAAVKRLWKSGEGSCTLTGHVFTNREVADLVRSELAQNGRAYYTLRPDGAHIVVTTTKKMSSRRTIKLGVTDCNASRVVTEFVAPTPLDLPTSSLNETWARVGGYMRESMKNVVFKSRS